jgi:iron complex outermembrane receptor protein
VSRSRTASSTFRFQPRAIGLAVALCLGAGLAAGPATAQTAAATPAFDIPAGPLGAALDRFARVAGVNLSYDAKAVEGRGTRGLSGAHDVDTGLRILLDGSGLAAVRAPGGFVLEAAPAPAPAGAATLEPVRVRAAVETDPAIGPVKGYVARESATATKTGTPLREIPQSISVIGRPEMEARGAANSGDPLLYTPGVLPVLYGADDRMNSGDSGVTSRGFDSAASNYLDGLRQPKSSTSWSYPRTEVYGLERVEVLRGPASTAFGQGDVGGVISRVSKQPDAQAPREVELQLGNFDRRQFAIDVGGAVGSDEAVQWRLVGVSLEHEPQVQYPGFRPESIERFYIAPSLSFRFDADTTLTLLGSGLRQSGPDVAWEYVNDNNQHTGVLIGEPSYAHYEARQWDAGYQFAHRFAPDWQVKQNLRTSSVSVPDMTLIDGGYGRAVAGELDRGASLLSETMRYTVVDTQLHGRVATGAISHQLLFGLDWTRVESGIQAASGDAPSLDINNPVYGVGVSRPTIAERNTDASSTQRQLGLYAQDQVRFGPEWLLTVGGRQDWVESRDTDHRANNFVGATVETSDHAFTGRVGLTWLHPSGLAPYVSWGQSFLPTPGVAGRTFEPTRGTQYELGVKYQPAGSSVWLTAAVYDLTKRNVLNYSPVAVEQVGEVRSRGIELEAKASLARGLDLAAQYTLNDIENTADINPAMVGKRPTLIPKHLAAAWLDYTVQGGDLAGLGAGLGARYTGSRYGDAFNTRENPSVTLVDAAAHYTAGPWRLSLNAQNLFDRDNGVYGYGVYYQGLRRTVTATARYRF